MDEEQITTLINQFKAKILEQFNDLLICVGAFFKGMEKKFQDVQNQFKLIETKNDLNLGVVERATMCKKS